MLQVERSCGHWHCSTAGTGRRRAARCNRQRWDMQKCTCGSAAASHGWRSDVPRVRARAVCGTGRMDGLHGAARPRRTRVARACAAAAVVARRRAEKRAGSRWGGMGGNRLSCDSWGLYVPCSTCSKQWVRQLVAPAAR
ncbi:unnamed protein product [Chondrus crispus]|uniref:Uncharacterized protein n=1 Tax=Chondrus crispus TaxID=2769 RepID=R7QIW4_CHOCR|nr:unnamed protein product [Chondrus crispus]CDF37416.1 unnamed protein product [Chondrus crispus]|eukprot:XP_005717235.1 unnamed protein product [Chondrus crispus]